MVKLFPSQSNPEVAPNDLDSSSTGATLSGWEFIEDHLMKHDSRMMKDYTDDIDTLLVFAALFSAILTTFVVGTYPLLQDDNSDVTNRLLAYQISIQAPNSTKPAFIEATISALLTSPSRAPATSTRWINILFFFSLVLSLAAALFGIMAKQWIREYMKWNGPLAAPRENVLVRQIRFEAWQSWNVKAIMWFIPFLLELAMIFFLVGVVILLWSLDNVVAIATTILVAAFLTLVSAFTILPIFFQRCPYKAPPTWVLLRIFRLLGRPFGFLRTDTAPTWRQRDMTSFKFTKKQVVRLREEMGKESVHLAPHGSFLNDSSFLFEAAPAYIMQDLVEVPTLLRALAWVAQASNNPALGQHITLCMDTLRPSPPPRTEGFAFKAHMFTNWCIIATMMGNDVSGVLKVPQLLPASSQTDEASRSRCSVTSLRKAVGVVAQTTTLYPQYPVFTQVTLSCRPTTGRGIFSGHSSTHQHVYPILDRVIASTLTYALKRWVYTNPYHWLDDDATLRRIFEIVLIMNNLSKVSEVSANRMHSPDKYRYLEGLCRILDDDHHTKAALDCRAPGLRYHAYMLANTYGQIYADVLSGLAVLDVPEETASQIGPLSSLQWTIRAFPAETVELECWSADDLSIFLWTAGQQLCAAKTWDASDSNEEIEFLLDRMTATVRAAQALRNPRIYDEAVLWDRMAPFFWQMEWTLPRSYHAKFHSLVNLFHCDSAYIRGNHSSPGCAGQSNLPMDPSIRQADRENELCSSWISYTDVDSEDSESGRRSASDNGVRVDQCTINEVEIDIGTAV